MRIKLTEAMKQKAHNFSELRMGGSQTLYQQRGEQNISKIQNDIYIGALAELIAYEYLKSKNIDATEPDFEIYAKKDKSFTADMETKDHCFHVKSQSDISAQRYGLSWLCQKTDKLLNNPKSNDYMVFVRVYEEEAEILGVVKAEGLIENNLLSEPKVPRYRPTKVALYWEEIINSPLNLWEV